MDLGTLTSNNKLSKQMQDVLDTRLEKSHVDCRNAYKGSRNNISILSHFKHCFNITPIALKNPKLFQYKDLRLLALYILCHYSKDSWEKTALDFNISIGELTKIAEYEDMPQRYSKEFDLFFKEIFTSYVVSAVSTIKICNAFLQLPDKKQKKLAKILLTEFK
jgi:hypothetical protein